jgi:hypothetical protein
VGADRDAKQKPKPKRTKSSGEGKTAAAAQGASGGKKGDIRRITAANVSAPQLAIIRPKHRRSISNGGSRSPSAAPRPLPHRRTQSAVAAPTLSPRPAAPARIKSTPNLGPLGPPPPSAPAPQRQLIAPPPSRVAAHWHPSAIPHNHNNHNTNNPDGVHPRRRRAEQPTPSVYTFASDSTKVGEIPMARWAEPFDFEAMARLNAEAALRAPANPAVAVGGRVVKRRGLFGLFRKTAPVEA